MGWEQNFICAKSFCKTNYHDIEDIQSEIDSDKEYIEKIKRTLMTLSIASPSEIIKTSEEFTCLEDISSYIEFAFEELDGYYYEIHKLEDFKEFWNTRSGDYVNNPNIKQAFKEFAKEYMLPEIEWQKEKLNAK